MNKVKDAADKVKSSTDQMSTSAKKANDEVTKFDRSAQKTQKSLLSWAKEKYSVLLEAKDKISPILSTIKGGLTNFNPRSLVGNDGKFSQIFFVFLCNKYNFSTFYYPFSLFFSVIHVTFLIFVVRILPAFYVYF